MEAMSLVIVLLVLAAAAGLTYWVVWLPQQRRVLRDRRVRGLRSEMLRADAEVEADYRSTRRRMNDAAGQSWRNVAE